MANNGTGVQIPVIIDIDQACQDAAARVKQAMAPLQRQLSNTPLNLSIQQAIQQGTLSAKDLNKWIKRIKDSLNQLAMTGAGNSNEFKTLLDAKIYLEDMQRATKATELEIKGMESSMAGLNAQLQASRAALNSSALGSPEWVAAAQKIHTITEEMAKWEAQMRSLGRNTSSIDQLRSQLTELERKWNALSSSNRKWQTQTNGSILQEYRRITAELEKEGKTLSQIIAEEQKRNQLVQRGAQNRRYEQFAMSKLAQTMAGLRQQAQFLQAAMDRTVPNTAQWNAYKAQLEQVNQRMNELTGKTKQQKTAMDATNASMQKQSALWAQLRSLAGMYLSVFGGLRLLKNIRETTAQFELQQVALGAVIQDTQKATSLFKQLKAAALESPFEIKDLVSYTKQLAAYQIETDKLFDTTKRLADVSAGLGVDMGRLILAYGQVRAAAVLRGQELRQFTEAGVPLVNKLAEKFSQLRGEMVSTGEVFELISKRAVPFSMISEIFEDMTEKGGIFYDMQRKQSYTLYGQWQKLKDAASLMYDEMGNTGPMRKAMEGIIQLTMYLMRNWQGVVSALKGVAGGYLLVKGVSLFIPHLTRDTLLYRKALQLTAQAQVAYNNNSKFVAKMLITQSLLLRKAAAATTVFSRAWYRLQAAMAGNWVTLVLTALGAIATHLFMTQGAAEKLRKELDKIGTDASLKADQSARNFERLAGIITDTTKSAAEQNEAMKELQRTYGDIIPAQKLQRDYLQGLKGDYKELTQAIAENIQMEAKRQKIDQITEAFSKQINRKKGQLRDELMSRLYGFSEDEVEATFIVLQNAIQDGLYDVNATAETRAAQFQSIMESYFGKSFSHLIEKSVSDMGADVVEESRLLELVQGLAIRYRNLTDAIQSTDDSTAQLLGTTGKYAKQIEDMEKEIADVPKQLLEEGMNPDDFEFTLQSQLRSVNIWKENLEKLFKDIDISDAFRLEGRIDFAAIYKAMESAEPQVKAATDRIRKAYEKLLPTDSFVDGIQQKFQKIAESQGASMNDLRNYLMSGEDDIEGYVKKLKEGSEKYGESIKKMNMANAQFAAGIMVLKTYTNEEVKAAQDAKAALDAMLEYLKDFDKKNKPKGSSSYVKPKFITDMEEAIKFMKDYKKGYDELSKTLSKTGALERESGIMIGRGTALGLNVDEQKRAAEDLLGWYQDKMKSVMDEMRKLGAKGNTVQDFLGLKLSDKGKNNKKLKDFQKLLLDIFDAATDLENSDLDKKLENALSKLSEKVKRSEAARKFYDNIFEATGSKDIATNFTLSVYGDVGEEFGERIQAQLDEALKQVNKTSLGEGDFDILSKAVSEQDFATIFKYMDAFPEAVQKMLKEAAKSSEQFNTDFLEDLAKTYQKTKTYEERINAILEAANVKKTEIDNLSIPQEQKESYKKAVDEKAEHDVQDVQIEALQNTYEWTKAFEELDGVSTKTLTNLKNMLQEYINLNASKMTPTQLKTVTKAMEKADEQIQQRQPIKTVVEGIKDVRSARKKRKQAKKDSKEEKQARDAEAKGWKKIAQGLEDTKRSLNDVGGAIEDVMSVFSLDGESEVGAFMEGMVEGYQKVASIIQICQAAQLLFNLIASANPIGAIVAALATAIALFTAFMNMKAAKAEKKIKKQKELVEQLEKSYDQLDKAMEKAFGSDYIYNYQKQLENLLAQQEAYNKMAELEGTKGKKKSSKKQKEYLDQAEEAAEKIRDMQSQLSEFFTGTDMTSAAEDFANAWIDAYKEFSNTTGAMTEEFNEMIQNMVTRSLGAKIMQSILQPLFDEIDNMARDGDLSAYEISEIARQAPEYVNRMNEAMTAMANDLSAAGYNLRGSASSLTGISRTIAEASEESILGLSAAINTQNFYISRIPSIDEKMSQIIALMGGTATGGTVTNDAPEVDLKLQYLSYLPSMASDVNEILVNLKRVISPMGTNTATHYIAMR